MGELRVRVLGGLGVDGLPATELGSRKGRTLLSRLALARGGAVDPDALIDAVWPADAPSRPRDQLSVLASRLRGVLGADRLVRLDAGYALRADWLDLDELVARADEAERRAAAGAWVAAGAAAQAALTVARGPLLPEEADADWARPERESAGRAVDRARLTLAEAELATGDPRRAADLAAEALGQAPYDEAALRVLMRASASSGRPALGLAAYAESRARLADELGVDPAPETQTVHALLLRGEPEAPVLPVARSAAVVPTVLPGRSRELELFDGALATAVRGGGGLVTVTAEAGMGKSRLLAEVAVRAAAAGARVLRGRCDELGRVLPLQPVLDALEDELRSRDADEVAELLGPQAALLQSVLGGDGAEPSPLAWDPGAGLVVLQRALLTVVQRLAGRQPVVVLVDDAHLADPATLAFLAAAGRRACGLLVVAAARPGAGLELPATTAIELGPLGRDAVAELVGADRADVLLERSGGHPLLLLELAAVEDTAGEPPESLRQVVVRLAERAGPAAATIRTAAVLGPEVDLDLLAEVTGQAAPVLLDALEAGARHRLLVERDATFVFRHALVREALAADVGGARRSLLHREAARRLAARPRSDPLVVAHHARLGGDQPLAATALVAAATVAAGRYDHAEAARLLTESLALVDDPQTRLARARAHMRAGKYADAAADLDVAMAGGRVGADVLATAALVAYYRHDYAQAVALGDEAAALARPGSEDAATALAVAGHALHAAGRLDDADTRLVGAVAGHSAAPRPVAVAYLCLLRVHQGRDGEVLQLTEQVTRNTSDIDLVTRPLMSLSRALALAHSARVRESLDELDVFDAVSERGGLTRYRGRADNCRGYLLRGIGLLERGAELNEAGLEAAQAIGQDEPQAHALLDLAEDRLLRGDPAGADELIGRAERIGVDRRHSYQWRHALRAVLLRGRLALAVGDSAAAEALAAAVVARAVETGTARYAALGRALASQAGLARGGPPDVAELSTLVSELRRLAGLEHWWIAADLARAAAVPALRRDAEDQVTRIGAAAGEYAEPFLAYAATRLDSTSI